MLTNIICTFPELTSFYDIVNNLTTKFPSFNVYSNKQEQIAKKKLNRTCPRVSFALKSQCPVQSHAEKQSDWMDVWEREKSIEFLSQWNTIGHPLRISYTCEFISHTWYSFTMYIANGQYASNFSNHFRHYHFTRYRLPSAKIRFLFRRTSFENLVRQ